MKLDDYMKLPYARMVQEKDDESGHYFNGYILELTEVKAQAIRWMNYM